MISLSYFYSNDDNDRKELIFKLENHCHEYGLAFVEFCIDNQDDLESKYGQKTPVVCIGPYVLYSPFSDVDLIVATKSALERRERLMTEKDGSYQKKITNGVSINRLDKLSYFISRYYVLVITFFLTLFVGIPFLAPVLAKSGHMGSANVIYKVYRLICHQLAFRSLYLFGEQPFYPRQLANIEDVITYEEIIGSSTIDLEFARTFIGNEIVGYKVAICERDIAIYGSLSLFGFIFHLSKKRIKMLPWYLWIIIALIPIAIDGVSQIFGLSPGWPSWVPIRESTPFLRILTGTLFGAGTGWYMYPLMEESMKETRITLHRKIAIVKKINQTKNLCNDEQTL